MTLKKRVTYVAFVTLVTFVTTLAFSQEVRRPTVNTQGSNGSQVGCNAPSVANSAMPLAYDAAGQATANDLSASGTNTSNKASIRIFSAWQSTSNTYTALTINVAAGAGGNSGDAPAHVSAAYSLDGGTSWTILRSGEFDYTILSATIPAGQNLGLLRVGVCAYGGQGNTTLGVAPGSETITVADIWTSGTLAVPSNGGSGNATGAKRHAVTMI